MILKLETEACSEFGRTSPIGRGRIALAIRVRGYSLTIERNPSPQPSPIEVGYIRLRQIEMPDSGKPELGGKGSSLSAVVASKPTIQLAQIGL
jgi:hypothetical protein